LTPISLAEILRNKKGLDGDSIGYGNEKALNQMLAHHAVIFKPEQLKVWVSSSPYQLGAFTAYDLNDIFGEKETEYESHLIDSLTIPEDEFLYTEAYENYEKYRVVDRVIDSAIENEDENFDLNKLDNYRSLNPNHWVVHYKSGLLYYNAEEYSKAKSAFETALQKEITTLTDCTNVQEALKKTNKKLK
jgi:tetratricopeptide (TPR) repeat protein